MDAMPIQEKLNALIVLLLLSLSKKRRNAVSKPKEYTTFINASKEYK
jgi:hypothetical protein